MYIFDRGDIIPLSTKQSDERKHKMKKLIIAAMLLVPSFANAATQTELFYGAVGYFDGCLNGIAFQQIKRGQKITTQNWIAMSKECSKDMEVFSTYRNLSENNKVMAMKEVDIITLKSIKGE